MATDREMSDEERSRVMARHCLALGWQVSALSWGPFGLGDRVEAEHGAGELSPSELLDLALLRVARLLESMAASSEGVAGSLPRIEDVRHAVAYSAEESGVRRALYDLHGDLLITLSGVEEVYGTAYRLGRALADTCVPSQTLAQLQRHLAPERATELQNWLEELRGALPEYAADAVAQSLGSWATWAASHVAPVLGDRPALSDRDLSVAAETLEAQGRRWRALLTGERATSDVLEPEDYEAMAASVLSRTRSVGFQAVRTFAVPLALAAALFGLGVALVVAWSGGARAIAGLGVMMLAVVVTWRVGAALLGPISDRLEGPFWRAECARTLADRLTTLPQVSVTAPDVPRPIRITRRHIVREAPFPGSPARQPGPDDTASGEPGLFFGPPLPPRDAEASVAEEETVSEEERGETQRLEAASRAPGRRH